MAFAISTISEVWVLIHKIIPVSNLPSLLRFVVCWQYIRQVGPTQVSLEPHDVLDHLIVIISEQDA